MQLFDNSGRRVPSPGLRGIVNPGSSSYRLEQPQGGHALGRCSRLKCSFIGTGLAFAQSTEFAKRSQSIMDQLGRNEAVAGIRNGVSLPICLPRLTVDDYGTTLNTVFLKAVERSFESQFEGRQRFENCLSAHLPGKVSVVPESRQQQLLERMQHGPVVGVYFPMALQGFSVKAARSHMVDLPSNFLLSGGLDVAAALAMYPDILGHCTADQKYRKPMLVLGGLSFGSDQQAQLTVSTTLRTSALEDLGETSDALSDFAPGLLVLEDNQ